MLWGLFDEANVVGTITLNPTNTSLHLFNWGIAVHMPFL